MATLLAFHVFLLNRALASLKRGVLLRTSKPVSFVFSSALSLTKK